MQPLILEEAAKSGLSSTELTFDMLRVAKTMRRYNVQVDQSSAYLLSQAGSMSGIHLNQVRLAESAIVEGCRHLLEILESTDLLEN